VTLKPTVHPPPEFYDVVFDLHYNLQRLVPLLPRGSVKLLHITGSHPEYSSRREAERIANLQLRRPGASYAPKRVVEATFFNRSLRLADSCSLIGNDYTLGTFPEGMRQKITLVTVSASQVSHVKRSDEYFPEEMEYLWYFGTGAVHKGLDLALEAFASAPELRLNVVGDAGTEADFIRIYGQELMRSPNVSYHGFLDPTGPEFEKIIRRCFCFVAPSCSEAISTAVATLLQIGLYPIVTRDTGVSLPAGAGIYLEGEDPETVRKAIRSVRAMGRNALVTQIRECQAMALRAYSREKFRRDMTAYLRKALAQRSQS